MPRQREPVPVAVSQRALAALVYGQLSASLYFALGLVSLWALGLTPLVLVLAGGLMMLAAAAYAEGAALLPGTGGSPAIARRAFGDAVGFLVGWAVLLDIAVVVALALLAVPHYALAIVGHATDLHDPADELVASALAVAVAAFRVVYRAPRRFRGVRLVAAVDLGVMALLLVLGVALVLDPSVLRRDLDVGSTPTWDALLYALPLGMLAFAGLEVVAGLLPRAAGAQGSLTRGTIGGVAGATVAAAIVAAVALSAFPVRDEPGTPSGGASAISSTWLDAPLSAVAEATGDAIADPVGVALRALVGLSAIVVLLLAAEAAMAAAARVIGELAAARTLPRRFARPKGTPPRLRDMAPIAVMVVLVYPVASLFDDERSGLAGIYSFGILFAFIAVFAAIIWLRFAEPAAPRPAAMGANVHFGDALVPLGAVVGLGGAWLGWLLAVGTHDAARTVPTTWLALGAIVFLLVRRSQRDVESVPSAYVDTPAPARELVEVAYGTILVPVKQAGPIEEEMLATAAKIAQAQEPDPRILALRVVELPLALPLDAAPDPADEQVDLALAALGQTFVRDYGVRVETRTLRARAISSAISDVARQEGVGLILLGAVPHPGQHAGRARVFSETVENLLRRAPCRVVVTSFPPGTASVDEATTAASQAAAARHTAGTDTGRHA